MQSHSRFILCLSILIASFLSQIEISEGSAAWPNEPAGATQLLDISFSSIEGNGLIFFGGDASIVNDPTAPLSPSGILQYRFAQGFVGGSGPAKHYMGLGGRKEIYIGYWWKPSNPWQGHSAGNKMVFLMASGFGNLVPFMAGPPGGPFHSSIYMPFPTSNGHLPSSYGDDPGTRHLYGTGVRLTPGQWHRIELYAKHSTTPTSRDGIVRWWVNGSLAGNYTNVNYMSDGWAEFQIAPTWGGVGETKSQTDYFWFDHLHISAPNGGGSNPVDMPSGPPAAPRILNVVVQ